MRRSQVGDHADVVAESVGDDQVEAPVAVHVGQLDVQAAQVRADVVQAFGRLTSPDDPTAQRVLVGALGVSGDGVEQNDFIAAGGGVGFEPPPELRIDNFSFNGVELPYLKFPPNPTLTR